MKKNNQAGSSKKTRELSAQEATSPTGGLQQASWTMAGAKIGPRSPGGTDPLQGAITDSTRNTKPDEAALCR